MHTKRFTGWLITLSALALAAVACSGEGGAADVASTPSPTPDVRSTPTLRPAAATPSVETPAAGPGEISPELAEFLQEIDRKMADIRGIPVADPVPFRFLGQEDLNAYVREQIEDPETIEEIRLSDALYTLLGLISPDADLFDLYAALLDAQVLGAYDPEEEEFVVLQRGAEFGPSQEFTYAHEYVHRLQDARFGLDQISDRLRENSDRSLAFTALVEGDATTSQQTYALRHLGLSQLSQIISEAQEALDGSQQAPYILQRGLEFPYVEGAGFVGSIVATRGFAAVDEAFGQPPDSTEQILHVEKFMSRELPVEVSLPDGLFGAGGPAGAGWEVVEENVFGEFFLKTWLEAIGAGNADAAEAAAGWGGDAVELAVNESGDYALAAKIVWDDSAVDADQFFLVLTALMGASPDFEPVNIGPVDIGVEAFQGPGGVIVTSTLASPGGGKFTAVAAASELQVAMPLVLALAG